MKWYYWLGIVVAAALGVATLVPAPASEPNLLGYYSHCQFAPVSTLIWWAIAGAVYWLGKRREKK